MFLECDFGFFFNLWNIIEERQLLCIILRTALSVTRAAGVISSDLTGRLSNLQEIKMERL